MAGYRQAGAGQFLGTASAPVSRQTSAEQNYQDSNDSPPHQDSPPSSEGTAVSNVEAGGEAPTVRFTGVPSQAGNGGDSNARHGPGDLAMPSQHTEAEMRRSFGTASAPATPADGTYSQQQPHLAPLQKSETVPNPTDGDQHVYVRDHADPAVAAGLLPESAAEEQHFSSRQGHQSHRSSGRNSPHAHHAKWPHAFNFPYAQGQTVRGSHQAAHSKPLYSLARPLPTREQRDAQKAYRDNVKSHTAPGSRRTTPYGSRNPSQVNLVGPGAHHPYNPYGIPAFNPLGPGAGHNLPYLEPGYAGGSHHHAASTGQSNEEIMHMLKQILKQQQGDKSGEGSSKDMFNGENEIREDEGDGALARKEGFGEEKNKKERTRRAERRGSLSSGSSGSEEFEDEDSMFPNPWSRFRHALREPFAEFLGTMLLVMFGTGVSLQYFLSLDPNVSSSPRGTYLSVSFGWGIGVGVGVWVAGGISGGHINPAVTLSLACFRGFPWKKVPGYVLAQIIGSTTGAGLNYAIYRGAINIFEGGSSVRTVSGPTATAALFSTYPLEYVTDATAFFQEFLNTAILLITVLAISDSNNAAPPDGLNPLVLLFLIVGIGACFGMQTAYCINPARDIGPRLVTWWSGYGVEVWNFRSQYWLWVPWCATLSGGLMGCLIYDVLIYTGSESPINRKWDWPWSKKTRSTFAPASKEKMPVGQTQA